MKCPYCGVNELGTGDINGKCCACENKFNNSGYPLLGEVRADVKELLTEYTQYLYDCNYLDDDWWCEDPGRRESGEEELLLCKCCCCKCRKQR